MKGFRGYGISINPGDELDVNLDPDIVTALAQAVAAEEVGH